MSRDANDAPWHPTFIVLHDVAGQGKQYVGKGAVEPPYHKVFYPDGSVVTRQNLEAPGKAQHLLNPYAIGYAAAGVKEGQPLYPAQRAAIQQHLAADTAKYNIRAPDIMTHHEAEERFKGTKMAATNPARGGKDPLEAAWKQSVLPGGDDSTPPVAPKVADATPPAPPPAPGPSRDLYRPPSYDAANPPASDFKPLPNPPEYYGPRMQLRRGDDNPPPAPPPAPFAAADPIQSNGVQAPPPRVADATPTPTPPSTPPEVPPASGTTPAARQALSDMLERLPKPGAAGPPASPTPSSPYVPEPAPQRQAHYDPYSAHNMALQRASATTDAYENAYKNLRGAGIFGQLSPFAETA